MCALTSSIVKMASRSLPIRFSFFDDIDCKDIIMTKIKLRYNVDHYNDTCSDVPITWQLLYGSSYSSTKFVAISFFTRVLPRNRPMWLSQLSRILVHFWEGSYDEFSSMNQLVSTQTIVSMTDKDLSPLRKAATPPQSPQNFRIIRRGCHS